jgi:predicted amidohydrolase
MGVAHEFGHSIGMHNDDRYYRQTYSDAEIRHKAYLNIMNIGQVIDAQNANFIVEQINYHYRNRLKTHKQFMARKRK